MDPAGQVQHGPHVPGQPHNLKGVSEMNKPEMMARETLKNSSLEKLLDLWELTDTLKGPQVPTVRGWLMDEIERRNPDGFDAWLGQDAPEDQDLRRYVLA